VVVSGDDPVAFYRDQELTAEGTVRDVVARWSADGGSTYSSVVGIADDHWYLEGCPFSGPSALQIDGEIVVTWMDGRQSIHPEQDSTTIWIDNSSDGGRTFGPDRALSDGGIHRWPMLARDRNGVLHIVWESQGNDGGIS